MKKFKFSILAAVALILAVTMNAFTFSSKNESATHVFQYVPNEYSKPSVEEVSNWEYVGEVDDVSLCTGNKKACRIVLSNLDVDALMEIKSTVNITAVNSTGNLHYVGSLSTSGTHNISNQN